MLSAAAKGVLHGCDTGMDARVAYEGGAVGTLDADLRHKGLFPATSFTAVGTR